MDIRKRRIKDVIVIEKSMGEDAKNSNFINTERTGNKKGSVTAKTKLLEGVSPSSEAKKDINILTNIRSMTAQSNLSTVTAVILKMVFIFMMTQIQPFARYFASLSFLALIDHKTAL